MSTTCLGNGQLHCFVRIDHPIPANIVWHNIGSRLGQTRIVQGCGIHLR